MGREVLHATQPVARQVELAQIHERLGVFNLRHAVLLHVQRLQVDQRVEALHARDLVLRQVDRAHVHEPLEVREPAQVAPPDGQRLDQGPPRVGVVAVRVFASPSGGEKASVLVERRVRLDHRRRESGGGGSRAPPVALGDLHAVQDLQGGHAAQHQARVRSVFAHRVRAQVEFPQRRRRGAHRVEVLQAEQLVVAEQDGVQARQTREVLDAPQRVVAHVQVLQLRERLEVLQFRDLVERQHQRLQVTARVQVLDPPEPDAVQVQTSQRAGVRAQKPRRAPKSLSVRSSGHPSRSSIVYLVALASQPLFQRATRGLVRVVLEVERGAQNLERRGRRPRRVVLLGAVFVTLLFVFLNLLPRALRFGRRAQEPRQGPRHDARLERQAQQRALAPLRDEARVGPLAEPPFGDVVARARFAVHRLVCVDDVVLKLDDKLGHDVLFGEDVVRTLISGFRGRHRDGVEARERLRRDFGRLWKRGNRLRPPQARPRHNRVAAHPPGFGVARILLLGEFRAEGFFLLRARAAIGEPRGVRQVQRVVDHHGALRGRVAGNAELGNRAARRLVRDAEEEVLRAFRRVLFFFLFFFVKRRLGAVQPASRDTRVLLFFLLFVLLFVRSRVRLGLGRARRVLGARAGRAIRSAPRPPRRRARASLYTPHLGGPLLRLFSLHACRRRALEALAQRSVVHARDAHDAHAGDSRPFVAGEPRADAAEARAHERRALVAPRRLGRAVLQAHVPSRLELEPRARVARVRERARRQTARLERARGRLSLHQHGGLRRLERRQAPRRDVRAFDGGNLRRLRLRPHILRVQKRASGVPDGSVQRDARAVELAHDVRLASRAGGHSLVGAPTRVSRAHLVEHRLLHRSRLGERLGLVRDGHRVQHRQAGHRAEREGLVVTEPAHRIGAPVRVAQRELLERAQTPELGRLFERVDGVCRDVERDELSALAESVGALLDFVPRQVQLPELGEVPQVGHHRDLVVAQPQRLEGRRGGIEPFDDANRVAVQIQTLEPRAGAQALDFAHAALHHPEVLQLRARLQALDALEALLHDAQAGQVREQGQTPELGEVEHEHLHVPHPLGAAAEQVILGHAVRLADGVQGYARVRGGRGGRGERSGEVRSARPTLSREMRGDRKRARRDPRVFDAGVSTPSARREANRLYDSQLFRCRVNRISRWVRTLAVIL